MGIRGLALAAILASAPAGAGELIAVPSGQAVTALDVVRDAPGPEGLTFRFRFVAPWIGEPGADFEEAAEDMQHLCDTYALKRLSDLGPRPAQVVISLADRPVPFGSNDPDVVQFFDAFSIETGRCEREDF